MSRTASQRGEHGFTLVELLVVILIIAILSAIAIPAFLHHRARAQDADAKTSVVTAVKAMETWRMDHPTFATATSDELVDIEPSLDRARGLTVSGTRDTYEVAVSSASGAGGGGPFRVRRDEDGRMERVCDGGGMGACGADGTW